MSKKSRKRNKKILAALALAGGAALMARRGKGTSAVTGVVNPNAPKTEWISKKDTVPAAADTAVDTGFQTKNTRFVDGKWRGPNEIRMLKAQTAGNLVPPSMRGGLEHAEGYQRRVPGGGRRAPSWVGGYSMRAKGGRIGAKKGGRVTGIAKRGFGSALMKGKK